MINPTYVYAIKSIDGASKNTTAPQKNKGAGGFNVDDLSLGSIKDEEDHDLGLVGHQ